MVRAVFFDSDETEGIYGEADVIAGGGMRKPVFRGKPTMIAGIDPAFTNGGDRTILFPANIGYDEQGQYVIEFLEPIALNDDTRNKAMPRSYQIAEQIKTTCIKLGIAPANVAIDSTGAGSPFCDIIAGEWSQEFLRVPFGGAPTDKRVSLNSRLTGVELYTNRVSELWFVGKEFLRTKQIRGLSGDLIKEMCARRYDLIKSGTLKVKVETKPELKARLGYSPDLADAAFIALDLARQRHGFVALDAPKANEFGLYNMAPMRTMRDLDVTSRSAHASLP